MLYFELEVSVTEGVFVPSPHAEKPKTRAINAVIYVIFRE